MHAPKNQMERLLITEKPYNELSTVLRLKPLKYRMICLFCSSFLRYYLNAIGLQI